MLAQEAAHAAAIEQQRRDDARIREEQKQQLLRIHQEREQNRTQASSALDEEMMSQIISEALLQSPGPSRLQVPTSRLTGNNNISSQNLSPNRSDSSFYSSDDLPESEEESESESQSSEMSEYELAS